MSALKEIVDRYERLVLLLGGADIDSWMHIISRAREELAERERGVDVRKLLIAVAPPLEVLVSSDADRPIADISPTLRDELRSAVTACREAANTLAGVRVVEDGKESSDGK